jgi:hypothetical protein
LERENSRGFFYSRLVLFLDLFGLLFLIVKVVFVPLLRFMKQKRSSLPADRTTKSKVLTEKGQVNAIGDNHTVVNINVSDDICR